MKLKDYILLQRTRPSNWNNPKKTWFAWYQPFNYLSLNHWKNYLIYLFIKITPSKTYEMKRQYLSIILERIKIDSKRR